MILCTRRSLLKGATAIIGASLMPLTIGNAAEDAPGRWLDATDYVDKDHRDVAATARRLTRTATGDLERALAIFRFVRDEIRFGFARGFWDNPASSVLASGLGYCNTKSTLFVALLRACGVPARQVFVDIHASVLHGFLDPGTPYVDHSYVEVLLNGAWVATDAYIVDAALFTPAQARVASEGRLMGYGVHATGTRDWDGRTPAFSQFNRLDPRPISTRHWGVFEDVGDFHDRADGTWNRLNPLLRGGFGMLAAGGNRRADHLRQGGTMNSST